MQAIISKQNRWLSKKRVFLALLVTTLITSVIIIVLGHLQWQSVATVSKAVSRQSSTLFKEVGDADTRAKRVAAAKQLAGMKSPSCNGEWWYAWQAGLPTTARENQSGCKDRSKNISNDVAEASRLVAYLNGEEEIVTILNGLRMDGKQKDWQRMANTDAQEAKQLLDEITPTNHLKKVHQTAQERVGAVVKAWASLDSASKKQDRTAYEKASESLNQAYADLSMITDVADAQVELLTLPFNGGAHAG